MAEPDQDDRQLHRSMAITSNGRAWELLEHPGDLSAAQREELLDATHASAFHWRVAGTAVHELRAH